MNKKKRNKWSSHSQFTCARMSLNTLTRAHSQTHHTCELKKFQMFRNTQLYKKVNGRNVTFPLLTYITQAYLHKNTRTQYASLAWWNRLLSCQWFVTRNNLLLFLRMLKKQIIAFKSPFVLFLFVDFSSRRQKKSINKSILNTVDINFVRIVIQPHHRIMAYCVWQKLYFWKYFVKQQTQMCSKWLVLLGVCVCMRSKSA